MTTEAPGIDRDIYPMPMFVTLAVHEHALVDTPWFTRDLVLTDLDGYTVVFTAWRQSDAEAAPGWNETVRGSVGRSPD